MVSGTVGFCGFYCFGKQFPGSNRCKGTWQMELCCPVGIGAGSLCDDQIVELDVFLNRAGRTDTDDILYPEEIEQKLNNMPYVCESIVIDVEDQLVALVYPDIENGTKQGLSLQDLDRMMEENVKQLNPELPSYSRISRVKVYHEEFEKTPKRSIKRYLYKNG
jgi:hypothetical protein